MTDATNPWLPQAIEPAVAETPTPTTPPLTGPRRPQHGVPAPDHVDQLPTRHTHRVAALWVLGAHGGAAESTIAALDHDWAAADHAWPTGTADHPSPVIVVARTSAYGLTAAKNAARQWAAGLVDDVDLLGLVLVADAPRKLPKPLRDLAQIVAGGYPRLWRLPWIEAWRLGDPIHPDTNPRDVHRLISDLDTLTTATPSPQASSTSVTPSPCAPSPGATTKGPTR